MPVATRTYSDLNLNMIAHPVTGDIMKLTGEDAVKRSIRNLVLTDHYERFYQPDIGSGVAHLLFEPIGPITARLIQQEILRNIGEYEPRAEKVEVRVSVDADVGSYRADIIFSIRSLTNPVELSLFLQRVR